MINADSICETCGFKPKNPFKSLYESAMLEVTQCINGVACRARRERAARKAGPTLPTYTYDLLTHDDGEIAEALPTAAREGAEASLRQALVDLQGSTMLGIETAVYWSGVLHTWPWADLPNGAPDEQDVTDAALQRATVTGTTISLTLAGSDWEAALIQLAEQEAKDEPPEKPSERTLALYAASGVTWQPVDLTFGLNQEAEMYVIARHVFQRAVEILTTKEYA